MGIGAKTFSLGSVLMAVFIFFITGLFSWYGNTTLINSKQNIKLADNLVYLNKTINKFGDTVDKFTNRISKIEKKERARDMEIYKMQLDIQTLRGKNE